MGTSNNDDFVVGLSVAAMEVIFAVDWARLRFRLLCQAPHSGRFTAHCFVMR
jgi:hypothetical protein